MSKYIDLTCWLLAVSICVGLIIVAISPIHDLQQIDFDDLLLVLLPVSFICLLTVRQYISSRVRRLAILIPILIITTLSGLFMFTHRINIEQLRQGDDISVMIWIFLCRSTHFSVLKNLVPPILLLTILDWSCNYRNHIIEQSKTDHSEESASDIHIEADPLRAGQPKKKTPSAIVSTSKGGSDDIHNNVATISNDSLATNC